MYHPHFATVIIKWSKTLQSSSQFATIQIPVLGSSPLCPVAALLRLINKFPLPPMLPSLPSPKASPSQSSHRAKSGRPSLPSSPHLALTPSLIPSMPSGGQGRHWPSTVTFHYKPSNTKGHGPLTLSGPISLPTPIISLLSHLPTIILGIWVPKVSNIVNNTVLVNLVTR